MNSAQQRVCADCGTALPEDSAASTCARCLLEVCFGAETACGAPESAGVFPSDQIGPGEVFGDYELTEEIARGGMGVVYKARQRSLGRIVALKMMLPGWLHSGEIVRRFHIEAQAASRLRHPGIVSIHDVGECDGQHFYSMDYIEGRNLVQRVEGSPVAPELAARWVKSIAEAIHHAHQHGILHRDLKPANVLVDAHDQPHVTDFGLAKLLDEARDITVTGHVLGTPSFMPPEQADPQGGGATVASDVYGLGAILYFLLTGEPPFRGNSMEQTIRLLLTEEPVPPSRHRPGIPRDLETICLKCLSKEPHRRYSSAADLADDLGAWSRHEPIRARPVPPAERLWFWARRNPGLAAVSLVLVLALIIGAVLMQLELNRTRRAQRQAEQNLVEARRARAAAEGLVQYMNNELTEQLRPLGRLSLLNNVNRTVQRYYEGLPMNEKPSDPVAGKAQFFHNDAAVLREMGRPDKAAESARSAISLLEPLAQQHPDQHQWAASLAKAHAEMRNILATADLATAVQHAQEAVRFSSRACELNPASDEAKVELANARLELACVLQQQKQTAEAAREIRLAADLLTTLPSAGTHSANAQKNLALSFYYKGLVQFDQGNKEQALTSFAEYLDRTERLASGQNDPSDARALHELAIAHGHLGRALLDMGEESEALKHFREYQRLAEHLEQLDPGNVNYRLELGFSLDWLATALERTRVPDTEIAPPLIRSREVFQKLANEFPQGDVWQEHAARALTRLAAWYGNHSDANGARALLAEELTNRWNLLLQGGDRRAPHARFLRALEWTEDSDGPPGASSDFVLRWKIWRDKVVAEAAKPGTSREWRRSKDWTEAVLHNKTAIAFWNQNQFESAQNELELALPIWKRLASEPPEDAEADLRAANTYCGIVVANAHRKAAAQPVERIRALADWLKTKRLDPATRNQILKRIEGLREKLAPLQTTWPPDQATALEELNKVVEQLKP